MASSEFPESVLGRCGPLRWLGKDSQGAGRERLLWDPPRHPGPRPRGPAPHTPQPHPGQLTLRPLREPAGLPRSSHPPLLPGGPQVQLGLGVWRYLTSVSANPSCWTLSTSPPQQRRSREMSLWPEVGQSAAGPEFRCANFQGAPAPPPSRSPGTRGPVCSRRRKPGGARSRVSLTSGNTPPHSARHAVVAPLEPQGTNEETSAWNKR